jgi:hypothetical protein
MATRFNRLTGLIAGFILLAGASGIALAGEFDGTWTLNDTSGKPFTAVLSPDGKASGTHNTSMKYGTWKEENGAAVIHWTTGWTTRIAKDGDKYVKTAFKPGLKLTDKPTSTTPAVKQK